MKSDLLSRGERNNRIINGVMSGKAPVLLLCPTSPSYLDFFADLTNNYRTVYTYDASSESQPDFLLCIAKKVLTKEEFEVARSYCKCFTEGYKKIILKKILSKIALIQNDCLFFFGSLEKIKDFFDASLWEYLLDNCPDNLKFVFCSTKIPHINYQIDKKVFPRIIICDKEGEELPFDGSVFEQGLISREQTSALCSLSYLHSVHQSFAEKLCPGIGELIGALSRTYRSLVLVMGKYYIFHPFLHQFLKEKFGFSDDFSSIPQKYVLHFYDEKMYVQALENALLFGQSDLFEKTTEALFLSKREDYLYAFYKVNKVDFGSSFLCQTIKKSIAGDIASALNSAQKIECVSIRKKACYALSLFTENRNEAMQAFYDDISTDFSLVKEYAQFIYLLSFSERRRFGSIPGFLQWTDKNILHETKDIYILHFLSRLYSATGRYASAKKYLEQIKTICEYYTYSYVQSWTFFFNMPIATVFNFAQETSNGFLECCSYLYKGNKAQALDCLKNIEIGDDYSSDNMLGMALQGMFYGEAGDPEFGRSLSLLYAVSCEREGREESTLLYISLAYCEWLLHNSAKALSYLHYGKKGYADAFFSFFAKALEINCNMEKERVAVVDKQIESLFTIAQSNGYDNAILVLQSCFLPLLTYAQAKEICPEYVSNIQTLLSQKKNAVSGKKAIQIKFFGNASVYIDRREISWKTKKCKELFFLYKLFPDGLERNKIIAEIWSDYVYASAVNNLKTTNNLIRKTLRENGVSFEFSYSNGKYKLITAYSESDYDTFRSLLKEYLDLQDMRKKTVLLNRLISYTEDGFASDCDIPCFYEEDKKIKEELSVYLSALIKELIHKDDYANAKRFLLKLERIGLFDCETLKTEIDKLVYKK